MSSLQAQSPPPLPAGADERLLRAMLVGVARRKVMSYPRACRGCGSEIRLEVLNPVGGLAEPNHNEADCLSSKLSALQTELTEQRDENDALLDRYDQRIAALKAERDGYASRLGAVQRMLNEHNPQDDDDPLGCDWRHYHNEISKLLEPETAAPTNSGPISSELVVERQLIDIAPGYVCPGCGRPYTAPGCPDCGSTGEHAFSCSQRSHPSE